MAATLAFDVGGTTTRIAVDSQGRRTYWECRTRVESSDDLLPHLINTMETALEEAGVDVSDVTSVGIGLPGTVDNERGTVRLASNLHIGDDPLPLRRELTEHIGVPTAVENDVKTAALGLVGHLPTPAEGVVTYVSVGTGIASATVIDGKLLRGCHGSAGEIGQIQLERDGAVHEGSLPGALEALAAGPVTSESPVEAADQLARAIHALFMILDPDRLVVGGGATEQRHFRRAILDAVQKLRLASPTTASLIEIERLEFLDPRERPGIDGAFHLARQIPEVSDRSRRSAQ